MAKGETGKKKKKVVASTLGRRGEDGIGVDGGRRAGKKK